MPDYEVSIEGTVGDYVSSVKYPFSIKKLILDAKDNDDAYNKAMEITRETEIELYLPHIGISRLTYKGKDVDIGRYKK